MELHVRALSVSVMQEQQHLEQFHLTVEIHLKQLFRSIIYVDLQKHVPDIVQQLRFELLHFVLNFEKEL